MCHIHLIMNGWQRTKYQCCFIHILQYYGKVHLLSYVSWYMRDIVAQVPTLPVVFICQQGLRWRGRRKKYMSRQKRHALRLLP